MKKAVIALGCLGGLAAGAVYAAPQIKERLIPDIGQQTAVIVNMHDSNMLSVDKVYMHEDQIAMDGSSSEFTKFAVGIGCGDNAKAALITRGMAEITRLGLKMGCMEQTFSGLAGIGDLIVTATSMHSRNNRCGILIGQGVPVDEAVKEIGQVVEGLNALPAALELSEKYEVEMPIVHALDMIVNGGVDPVDMVERLMSREKKSEIANDVMERFFQSRKAARRHN